MSSNESRAIVDSPSSKCIHTLDAHLSLGNFMMNQICFFLYRILLLFEYHVVLTHWHSVIFCLTTFFIQVFFRAGVLGQMEDFRDQRLSKIMSWMQSWCRGYLSRVEFKKMQSQRVALEVVQRNLRKYLKLRTWGWWKLWQKVKPLLNVSRVEDQIAVSMRLRLWTSWNLKCAYFNHHFRNLRKRHRKLLKHSRRRRNSARNLKQWTANC